MTALRPSSLSAGTVSNTGLGTLSATYQWMTRREALDGVCRALGAEWRVNPAFTLDAAKSPDLFVSTPTVVITRKEEGQDGSYRGLDGTLIVTAKDVRQYTTKAIAVAQGQGATAATGSSSGSTSYKDGLNNTVVLERLVNAPSDSSANASTIAAQQVGQWNQVRRELSLNSRTYNVTRHAKPGDYVYVFDQLAELTDPANQITFRGELISPIKLRVYALTWPIERGMGVYARRSGATPTYTDLTDFVEWEDGSDVQWDVGAAPRSSNDTDAASAGATAYLGANASVAGRATSGEWIDYTPTFSGTTLGNGAVAGEYAIDANGTVTFSAVFVLGSTSAVTGSVTCTLPVTGAPQTIGQINCAFERPGFEIVGGVTDRATTYVVTYAATAGGTYVGFAALSATVPFSWGTGHKIWVSGSYQRG